MEIDYIQKAIDLDRWGKGRHAINVIFDNINNRMLNGEFDILNQELKDIDVSIMSIALMLSILTITMSAKNKLDYRSTLFDLIEHEIRTNHQRPTMKLLHGLK